MRAANVPVAPGEILAGKYRVERVIGVGGMGVVVVATHLDLGEARAIKFMLPTALSDAELVDRFLREARAASRLKNEHVARVHDVGRLENGAPYMVMEYLSGTDLSARLKREGPLHYQEAILYVLQACEALAEAHATGVIHRDLKPANLFLADQPDGTPIIKVLDFGISKALTETAEEPHLTRTNVVLGSPHYMSPEQMSSSRSVDTRADIWSLGVLLYQLITGKLPFRGAGITEIIAQVLQGTVTPPSQLQPGVPTQLDPVIFRCLERDPNRRHASVVELAQWLGPFVPAVAPYYLERIGRIAVATPAGFVRATGNSLPLVATPLTPRPAQLTPRPAMASGTGSSTGTFGATTAPSAAPHSRALPMAMVGVAALLAGVALTYIAIPRAPQPLPTPPRDGANAASAATIPSAPSAPTASASASAAASATATATAAASASATAAASARPAMLADPFGSSRK